MSIWEATVVLNLLYQDGRDPFAVIEYGKEKFRTSVMRDTLDPKWNEECELFVSVQRIPKLCLFTLLARSIQSTIRYPLRFMIRRVGKKSFSEWSPSIWMIYQLEKCLVTEFGAPL